MRSFVQPIIAQILVSILISGFSHLLAQQVPLTNCTTLSIVLIRHKESHYLLLFAYFLQITSVSSWLQVLTTIQQEIQSSTFRNKTVLFLVYQLSRII